MDSLTIVIITLIILLGLGVALALKFKGWRAKEATLKTPLGDMKFEPPAAPTPPLPCAMGEGAISQQQGGVGITGGSTTAQRDIVGGNVENIQTETYIEQQIVQAVPAPRPPAGSSIPSLNAATFVPRGKIMDDLRGALRARTTAAIVGVGGMGGVGKTELAKFLALECENDNPQSVLWLTVADKPLGDVQNEIARALGVDVSKLNARHRADALRAALRDSSFRLVVLDDIRKEFAADVPLCLPPSPPCACLITSRRHELVGVPTGAIRNLYLMDEPQALALLNGVAALVPALAREQDAAKTLCKLCGYHPLALDLAARRLRKRLRDAAQPIAFFNQRLTDRLGGLKRGENPQESLAANFDLSYGELMETDKVRYRQLAVFAPTGFSVDGAAAVWEVDFDTARGAVEQFQDMSLVQDAEGAGRFRLHDLLYEYAASKLGDVPDAASARNAHARWIVQLFDAHYTDDPSTAPEITLELENLRSAIAWAHSSRNGELLALLVTKPRNWMFILDWLRDWYSWLQSALQLRPLPKQLEANVLKAIGDVQQFRDERDAALQSYEQALGLFRAVGAKLGEANVLQAIGDVQQFRDERDAALTSYEQALGLFRAVGAKLGEANTYRSLGLLELEKSGDMRVADDWLEKAVALHMAIGSIYSVGVDYWYFADRSHQKGEKARAKIYAVKAEPIFRSLNLPFADRMKEIIDEP